MHILGNRMWTEVSVGGGVYMADHYQFYVNKSRQGSPEFVRPQNNSWECFTEQTQYYIGDFWETRETGVAEPMAPAHHILSEPLSSLCSVPAGWKATSLNQDFCC